MSELTLREQAVYWLAVLDNFDVERQDLSEDGRVNLIKFMHLVLSDGPIDVEQEVGK